MSEISNRPYFLRALYEWMVDNEWTPHVQVDVNWPGIQVPFDYAEGGTIVLNIGPSAVLGLQLDNDWIRFKARFGGVEQEVGFPPEAVLTIFARENGRGMPFPPEPYPDQAEVGDSVEGQKPVFSVVVGKKEGGLPQDSKVSQKASVSESVKKSKRSKKRPHLSVVK